MSKERKSPEKGIVVKPIISRELNSRCQVDLVDMQTCKDGEYKFILNYQDHQTKCIQQRIEEQDIRGSIPHVAANFPHFWCTKYSAFR